MTLKVFGETRKGGAEAFAFIEPRTRMIISSQFVGPRPPYILRDPAIAAFDIATPWNIRIDSMNQNTRDNVGDLASRCADVRNLFPSLLAANLFGVVAPRMDAILLGYWASSADVGQYLVLFQTAAMLALVLGAFDVAFAPIMSQAWARKDDAIFRECYAAVHRMAAMATVPLFVSVVVFREEMLSLFGHEIGTGSLALTLLALGYLVNSMTGGVSTVLLMTGRSRTVLINTMAYGSALVAGTSLLIPVWGILGAAISASCALIGVNILRVWQCHAKLPWTWKVLKPLAADVAMGLVVWLLKPYAARHGLSPWLDSE